MAGSERERQGSNGTRNAEGGESKRQTRPSKRAKTTAIVPIYARLPKGPHSIGATGVARNQRIRMHGGMIEAVTTRGYERTSVRLVIGLAGVSRRVFYEQFSGKEDCFLTTFDLIVKRAAQRLTAAYGTAAGGPEKCLRVALEAVGAELEQNPKALRLVMLDAQTAGAEGVRRLQRITALCESRLSSVLSEPRRPVASTGSPRERAGGRPAGALPLPVVRGIVGGLRRVTSTRLRNGDTVELGTLTEEMLKWSLLFSSPAAAELRPRPCANPPFVDAVALEAGACGGESSRARLLRSAIELRVREQKPDELSSLRIADGAGLPVEAFIELFPGPDACYLEALDVLGDEVLQVVADPGLVSAEWSAAVCRTVAHVLGYLASSPARLKTLAVKAFEAGPPAIANMEDLTYEIATLLTEGAPRRPRTQIAAEGIAGALSQILACEVLAGRGHRLPVLCEYVSYAVLAPFVGPNEAVQAIVHSRARETLASPGSNAEPHGQAGGGSASRAAPTNGGVRAAGTTRPANGTHATPPPPTNGTRATPPPPANGTHVTPPPPANGTHVTPSPAANGTRASNTPPIHAPRTTEATPSTNATLAVDAPPSANGTHTGNATPSTNGRAADATAAANGARESSTRPRTTDAWRSAARRSA
jgi:AcrR family transcriptional regulator